MPPPRKDIDPLLLRRLKGKPLLDALLNLHPISFTYTGPTKNQPPWRNPVKPGKRVKGKPVAIGISKRGTLLVRVHVEPPSVSRRGFKEHGWRTFILANMRNIQVDKTKNFHLSIPKYNGGGADGAFARTLLFITPESAKENTQSKYKATLAKKALQKQEAKFDKITKQRRDKAKKELREKNRKK